MYDFPSKKKILGRRQELQHLDGQYRGSQQFVSGFGQLLYDYIDELGDKIALIEAYKKQDADLIRTYNERLYGSFDNGRMQLAMEMMRTRDNNTATAVTQHSSADFLS